MCFVLSSMCRCTSTPNSDDSDGKIVAHECNYDVLNLALWKTSADSIEHHCTIFIGAPREILKAKILEGEKTHLQTQFNKERKLQR